MAFDFQEWARNQKSGGTQYQPQSNPYSSGNAFSWQDFANNYNQIANANRQMQQQRNNLTSQSEPTVKKYRQMTDLEKIAAGARVASDYISNFAGNALFGEPEEGEDVSEISLKNVPRTLANIPGMFLSSIPDIFAYGSEYLSDSPTQTANLETGMIEDRALTEQERLGDLGYLAASIIGFTPLGVEGKAVGLGAKAVGKAAGAGSKFGQKLTTAGNLAYKMDKEGLGTLESYGLLSGKTQAELNPYRWGDVALNTIQTSAFEGGQEAAQTLFEDMRYDQLDEDTMTRMGRGAFWGGLAGGLVGGVMHAAPTALENSRAKNGLDKYGKPFQNATDDSVKGSNWYDWSDNLDIPDGAEVTPEAYKHMLETPGNQRDLETSGSSLKAVPGSLDQKSNQVKLGVRSIRRQYENAYGDNSKVEKLAADFLMDAKSFRELMKNPDDVAVANMLGASVRKRLNGPASGRLVYSTARSPYAIAGSHLTFWVSDIIPGNTIQYGRGITEIPGGDLDGDMWAVFSDPTLAELGHLPTRRLTNAKATVEKNSSGRRYTQYASTDFGFKEAGITNHILSPGFEKFKNNLEADIRKTLSQHGIADLDAQNKVVNDILSSFKTTEEDDKADVKWEMKLASVLSELVDFGNETVGSFVGDDLVEDILLALSANCSTVSEIRHCGEGYGFWDDDSELSPELSSLLGEMPSEATTTDMPTSKGDLAGKVSIAQMLSWFGKIARALSEKDNPMFRFKQTTYWNTKVVSMMSDLIDDLGLRTENNIETTIKWCMQIVNAMELPVDYINSLFVSKCFADLQARLGINNTEFTRKLGPHGITYAELKAAVTEVWNQNAKLFDDAMADQIVTNEEAYKNKLFCKTRVKEDQPNSFANAFGYIFGAWSPNKYAEISLDPSDPAYNLSTTALVRQRSDPYYGQYKGGHVYNSEFNKLLGDLDRAFQSEENARVSSIVSNVEAIQGAPIEFTEDENGVVSWRPEDEIAVSFLVRAHQKTLGISTAMFFGIAGPKWAQRTGWGKYLFTKNKDKILRAYVAMGVTKHWAAFIDIASNPEVSDISREYALSTVDFSNPVNRWIYARMLASEEMGKSFYEPLLDLANPEIGTYEEIADKFDRNNVDGAHVRPGQNMLLAYALEDPSSSLLGSDLSTRGSEARAFIDQMKNNSYIRSVNALEEVKALPKTDLISEDVLASSIMGLAREVPDTMNMDAYAVCLHDSQFASGDAAGKARAANSASLHWSALTDMYGGLSASFLNQLGASIGQIDSGDMAKISSAIRKAFIDPSYSEDVQISSNTVSVHISRDSLFETVDIKLEGREPTWNEMVQLFNEAPQLLLSIIPHTYEPASVDSNVMSLVYSQSPVEAIREYIRRKDDPSYIRKINVSKVESRFVADQDSTILVFGTIDDRYDELVSSPKAWADAVKSAVSDWSEFIYDVSRIQDPYERRSVIESQFSIRNMDAFKVSRDKHTEAYSLFEDACEKVGNKAAARKASVEQKKARAFSIIDGYLESQDISKQKTPSTKDLAGNIANEYASAGQRVNKIAEFEAMLQEAFIEEFIDVNSIRGGAPLSNSERAELIDYMKSRKKQDENGNEIPAFADDEINNIVDDIIEKVNSANLSSIPEVEGTLITRQDINTTEKDPVKRSSNRDAFISKVKKFYEDRKYRRTQSDYINWERGFNGDIASWEERIIAAYDWTPATDENGKERTILVNGKQEPINRFGDTKEKAAAYVEEQGKSWNREIIYWTHQDLLKAYNAGYATDYPERLDQARDFIYKIVDEVRSDNSISETGTVSPGTISMPKLSYDNPSTSNAIEMASVELEASGASIMSGQNAGAYQWFGILDLIQEDFSCPAELRYNLTREQALELLENEAENYIPGIFPDKTKQYLDYNTISFSLSDEEIAAIGFAPRQDCLFGVCCHNHGGRAIGHTSGSFISGRYDLAKLGWVLSEKRTFKAKKLRRVFDKIARVVKGDDGLKGRTLSNICDRSIWLKEILEYQEDVANHIQSVFHDEQLDSDFGINESRVFAQMMTPAIEVTFIGADGEVHVDTISKWSLASDDAFERELLGSDPEMVIEKQNVISARPIAMSIISVCKKITTDIDTQVTAYRANQKTSAMPSNRILSEYAHHAMESWRGKVGTKKDLANFLKNMPVLKKATGRSMRFSSSPNAMQNFLIASGAVQRPGVYTRSAVLDNAVSSSYDKTSAEIVKAFNEGVKLDPDPDFKNYAHPVFVHVETSGFLDGLPITQRKLASMFGRLSSVANDFIMPDNNSYSVTLIPQISGRTDSSAIRKVWDREQKLGRAIAIYEEDARFFEGRLRDLGINYEPCKLGTMKVSNMQGIDDREMVLYKPYDAFEGYQPGSMHTFVEGFDPAEIIVSIADWGRQNIDNSGSIYSPEMAKIKIPFNQSDVAMSKEILLGNLPKSISPDILKYGLIDLNKESIAGLSVREEIKREIIARSSGSSISGTESAKLIMPKIPDISEEFLLGKVLDYLNRPSRDVGPDGTVLGKVNANECINIIGVKANGNDVYYIPVIMHVNGSTPIFDSVWIDRQKLSSGKISLSWDANLTLQEQEGLKIMFPKVPYKSYGRIANEDELAGWLSLGHRIPLINMQDGSVYDLSVKQFYSGAAEEKRIEGAGDKIVVKLENLATASFAIQRDYFSKFKDANGNITAEKLEENKIPLENLDMIRRMQDWGNIEPWQEFVYSDSAMISSDEEENKIFKNVVLYALDKFDTKVISPLVIFNTKYLGKMRYIRFNEQLVYECLFDEEMEIFFHALDPMLCLDGRKETLEDRRKAGTLPLINSEGQILLSDGNYHTGHIQFARYAKDSSMLGNPSGKAKWGIQQIINEGLVEGLSRDGDMGRLYEYAKGKNGDPRSFFRGGEFSKNPWVDPITKNPFTEEKLKEKTGLFDSSTVISEDSWKHPEYRSPRAVEQRKQKLADQWYKEQSSEIEFSGPNGEGIADLSKGSAERIDLDDALSTVRSALSDMPIPLEDLEIYNLFRQLTVSTWNNGNGGAKPPVSVFKSWATSFAKKINSGEYPFEHGRLNNGRLIFPAIVKPLLSRLMTSKKFSNLDNKEWSIKMFEDQMWKDTQESFDSIQYVSKNNPGVAEAWWTNCDFVWATYNKKNASRALGESGMHLQEFLENSDSIYDRIGETNELPHIKEKKAKTNRMMQRQLDKESKLNSSKVVTDSTESGFIARQKARGRGAWTDPLVATSRVWAVATPELPVSAIIQRAIVQGQNKIYMAIDQNLSNGIISGNMMGIKLKHNDAIRALSTDPVVQRMWQAIFLLGFKGENLLLIQKAKSPEELDAIIKERLSNMTWIEKMQYKMFKFSAGGRIGMSWQIENWVHRLAMKFNQDNAPELCAVGGPDNVTRFEQMIIENPQNFVFDMLFARDDNPYFIEATQARNWVVNREHNGESFAGLVMTDMFEKHPFGKLMMITGISRFPHYAYNVGGWFVNHFAPVSTFASLARGALVKHAQEGKGRFAKYLRDEIGTERLEGLQTMDIKEALINDAIMMGSTCLAALLFGLGAIDPPDDEYYDEYAGNPEEWTIAGFRIGENWWLMDILGPFAAMACTWKSIEIGKPRFDLLTNWMTQALWSNPIIRTSDIVRSLLDPTEQYMEEYNQIADQYNDAEGGAPSMAEMFLDDSISYGLNWVGQFITPSFLKELYQSRESQQYERSYKKVLNSKGELVQTDYLDSRIRKLTRSNPSLAALMNVGSSLFGDGETQSGYFARQMPKVTIPDQNQLSSMQYYSLYNEDGSEKSEAEKQYVAWEVLSVLSANDDLEALYNEGFVVPMETRIYASQMLNDWKQYETDQYNDWVQATGTNAYIVGDGDYTSGMITISKTKEAYYNDLRDINKLFDKLWSDEMNRGLQMYYRLPTTYAKTTSGEYYATGYSRSISPLQFISPIITARGTDNAWFGVGTNNEGTLGKSGNWETESAVIPGVSAGGRSLVPIEPESIKKPKLEDFASDDNNGYSDTESGKALAAESSGSKTRASNATSYNNSTKYSSGSGGSGRSSGGGYRSSAGGFYAPSVSLPRANSSRIMNTDRAIKSNYDYLRPDFETKGSREAYRRSDI